MDKQFNDEECAIDPGKSEVSKESASTEGFNDGSFVDFECGKQVVADGDKQADGFNDDAALGIDDGRKIGNDGHVPD
jgi:hypothetical protein